MPFCADPEAGFVATANGAPPQSGKGPFLGADWLDGYRHARIEQVLETRHDWTLAETLSLQLDQVSLLWRDLRDIVLEGSGGSPDLRLGRELLADWNGQVAADSAPASVFEFLVAGIMRRIFEVKAPRTARWALGRGAMHLIARPAISLRRLEYLSRLIREQPEGWFPEGWSHEIDHALGGAVSELGARYGRDPDAWAWGRIRPLVLQHAAGRRALLDKVYNLGPFPWGGDACTVGQASVDLACPRSCSFGIATLRIVVDLGNWQESRFVLPSGQSGNPLSPHYADQHPLWRRGEGIPIAWDPKEVDQVARSTLRLVPAG
jgi:penicillin amidase